MDPLASVKEFRQQEKTGGRALKMAPPAPVPVTPAAPGTMPAGTTAEAAVGVDLNGLADAGGTEAAGERKLRGTTRGQKQLLYVYLPGPTIERLDNARPGHGTLGGAVMAALRGSYEWLVETHTPQPVEAVGPFPAVRGPKRRQGVEDGRLRPIYVTPEEAKGIDTLAEQLEMTASELVTVAIDHWFGEGDSGEPRA